MCTNHLLDLCSCVVNLQRLFCSQKAEWNVCIKAFWYTIDILTLILLTVMLKIWYKETNVRFSVYQCWRAGAGSRTFLEGAGDGPGAGKRNLLNGSQEPGAGARSFLDGAKAESRWKKRSDLQHWCLHLQEEIELRIRV